MSYPGALILMLGLVCLPSAVWADAPAEGEQELTARLVGQGFVTSMLSGDLATAESLAAVPFSFDGAVAQTRAELGEGLAKAYRASRAAGLAFLKARAFSGPLALRRFGEPPPRVRALCGPGTFVVLARLNRNGIVLFLRRTSGLWRVVGATD